MRRRVKLIYSAERGWHSDLPTYTMIPGSVLPVIPRVTTPDGVLAGVNPTDPRLATLTVDIDVPDALINQATGEIDIALIREVYRGNPLWDTDDRVLNV